MTKARFLLYTHCLVALACAGLVVFALGRQAELGWRYGRRLEAFFAVPAVSLAYAACLLSCLAFPLGVAGYSAGHARPSLRRLVVAADVTLAAVQCFALVIVYPVRD
jgi:hypothetical protein